MCAKVRALKDKESDTETWKRVIWVCVHVNLGLPYSPETSGIIQVIQYPFVKSLPYLLIEDYEASIEADALQNNANPPKSSLF